MAIVFPPQPVYPYALDSDYTLFLVYNTSEAALTMDNSAWAQEINLEPVGADEQEIWADNGFANLSGELFYYDTVEKDDNGKVNKLKRCARNLGGSKTKFNPIGTMVRGFVIAEHHNQLVDTAIIIERFVGTVPCNDPDDETIVCLLEELELEPECLDDNNCPSVNFEFTINEEESDTCLGTIIDYNVTISGQFTGFRIDFGDNNFSLQQSGSHTYATNAIIDPVVTVSNDDCQIIQTPIERDNPADPITADVAAPFEIPIPIIPDFPVINIPENEIPEQVLTLPQIVFPCIDIGPIGGISVPSVILIEPPIPSLIEFGPVNIPSSISIDSVSIPSEININSDPINLPTLIEFGPVDIPTLIEFAPFSADIVLGDISIDFPSEITFGPVNIPTLIEFGPLDFPTLIEFGPVAFPTQITFGPAPSIPTQITFGPAPSIPTEITFGPAPSIPTEITFGPAPSIPTEITFGPAPSIPTEITFGPAPGIPSVEFGAAPSVPVVWGTPPTVSCVVTVACPSASPFMARGAIDETFIDNFEDTNDELEINYENIGIPSEIKIIPPQIPDIRVLHDIPNKIFVELEKVDFPTKITIEGPTVPIPKEIRLVSTHEIPTLISLDTKGLDKTVKLDTTDLPEALLLVMKDIPSIKLEIPSDFPSKLVVEGIPEKIQVEGVPSTIEIIGDIPREIIAKLEAPKDLEVPLVYKGGPIPLKLEINSEDDGSNEPCFKLVPCTPK